jgi:hypothetical protein
MNRAADTRQAGVERNDRQNHGRTRPVGANDEQAIDCFGLGRHPR